MMPEDLKGKRIGVLMGGLSSEREISLASGKAVLGSLLKSGYKAQPIDVGRDLPEQLKKERIDVAFIALHGGHGENGAVQGMLEVMGIPYTGSGVLASALAMDKEASKKIFLYHGIAVPPFRLAHRDELPGLGTGRHVVNVCYAIHIRRLARQAGDKGRSG